MFVGKLVLLRHGQSQYNLENRFTGWTDVPLSEKGKAEARVAGKLAKEAGLTLHVCYCSLLSRTFVNASLFLGELGLDLDITEDWRLNERHYGALQGMKREDAERRYGKKNVERWRRGYFDLPPLAEPSSLSCPLNDPYFAPFLASGKLKAKDCPLGESLKMTEDRIRPFLRELVFPELQKDRNILISAHGNSIRAICKILSKIGNEAVFALEIPFGVPYVYEFDGDLTIKKKGYLAKEFPS